MAPIRIFPPSTVANDVASVTIAGHAFASAGVAAGGIVNLRVSLGGTGSPIWRACWAGWRGCASPLARRSPPAATAISFTHQGSSWCCRLRRRAATSRRPCCRGRFESNPPKLAVTCDLSAVFASLMRVPTPPSRSRGGPSGHGIVGDLESFTEDVNPSPRRASAGQDPGPQDAARAQDPAQARDLAQAPRLTRHGLPTPRHAAADAAGTSGLGAPVTIDQSC